MISVSSKHYQAVCAGKKSPLLSCLSVAEVVVHTSRRIATYSNDIIAGSGY
jgi:hypothetical protein